MFFEPTRENNIILDVILTNHSHTVHSIWIENYSSPTRTWYSLEYHKTKPVNYTLFDNINLHKAHWEGQSGVICPL